MILAVFFTAAAWVGWIDEIMPETVIGLDGIGGVVTTLPGLPVLAAVLWLAAAAWFVLDRKRGAAAGKAASVPESDSAVPGDALGPWPRRIWKWAMILIAVAVVAVFIDANFLGHGDRYGALANFLVFDDNWGTQRGFVWRITFEDYLNKFTPWQRVFKMEMHYATGQIYDSAHNAYIHYFATIGPIGLAGYLVFIIGTLRVMAKNWKAQPCLLGLYGAVLTYSAQALVNIDLPIATPFMWAFAAIGVAAVRRLGRNE